MSKTAAMPITNARVIVTCPGRNFVTLKIETADGSFGLGDATLNGRELAVVSYLSDHVLPCLIGRDAHQIEDIWQFLYRGAYWRRGPVTMTAIAAVDTALWDLKAKAAGMPLYQLLGGACRSAVRVYGHANGETVEETIAEAQRYVGLGYTAIRLQSGVPGLASTYGVSRDKMFYEPAAGALPAENRWSTRKYLASTPELFEAARAALGGDVDLLHDTHHRLTPIEAARLGKDLEPYRLFWLEDTVAADNQASLAIYGALRRSPRSTTSKRAAMEPPISRRYAWPRRCISIWRSPTSGCRSTCATRHKPMRYSPTPIASTKVSCIPAMSPDSASISMRPSPPNTPISALISPSIDSRMAR